MKYFKKELWEGMNNYDGKKFDEIVKKWDRNVRAYYKQLKYLKPRLNKRAFDFFNRISLHDASLLSFNVGDGLHFPWDAKIKSFMGQPRIEMHVLGAKGDMIYTLNYSGLKQVYFDFPTKYPLFHRLGGSIGDWGYHELTATDKSHLRHEILFSSGASIIIGFMKFSYSIIKRKTGCFFQSKM